MSQFKPKKGLPGEDPKEEAAESPMKEKMENKKPQNKLAKPAMMAGIKRALKA